MSFVHALVLVMFSVVYVWTLYQLPILAIGVSHLRRYRNGEEDLRRPLLDVDELPTISIIVPVKDEEKVVGRLLEALLKLDYPPEKREIVIVEDGSKDRTVEICEEYVRKFPGQVKLIHKPTSSGKPPALNYALKHVKGDIVAFFDADSVPKPDALKRAIAYFSDPSVAAVQGRLFSINADENMLTKLASYGEIIWCEAYLRGRDSLGLFVYLRGSCQFIRRDVLMKLNGFDEKCLSEDMELSIRLTRNGYRIRYATDVRSWQETPSKLRELFKQRTRWYRGTMQVALKHGRLMVKLDRRNVDAELTLMGPFVLIISLISSLLTPIILLTSLNSEVTLQLFTWLIAIGVGISLAIFSMTLACIPRSRRIVDILRLLFLCFYWYFEAFAAFYAMLLILSRRPQRWIKTEKTGSVKIQGLRP
ncbi:MAG: glycosyltransferase family 2 protein [Candidatus Nezhaarchaeales archaeon]